VASPPLETHYTPTYRGAVIRKRLLCNPIPPPLNEIEFEDVGDLDPRERLLEHENNPTCSGCHELMDPLGFTLVNYDDLSRYREEDAYGRIDPAD